MSSFSSPSIRPARPADIDLILSLICELAAYEKLSHQVSATKQGLRAALFPKGGRASTKCLLAFVDSKAAGFAIHYPNFSTFLGREGLFLEDLFVRPEFRRRGVGRALWMAVAEVASKRSCGRMDWLVLSWNKKAQRFYRSLGARHHPTWTLCRIDGDGLARHHPTAAIAKPRTAASTPSRIRAPKVR